MKVHLVLRHPSYLYNPALFIKAAEVMAVYLDKKAAEAAMASMKSSAPAKHFSMQTKVVKELKT